MNEHENIVDESRDLTPSFSKLTPSMIQQSQQGICIHHDDSASFSFSMADSLRLMTPSAREYAKMRIQQVIYECAYGNQVNSNSEPPSIAPSVNNNHIK